ncbi:sugar phosphate isomerase/epimerase family protein [Porphyrobacter sp. YT40]|uniref:sugar phosphate isomerase/epimerase family protein n=1 Tax=Porphyrobacter sp. YT40 TaxID=2547601 RepID=UPI0011431346|nr:sugar phosphate isomerase/epimerase family protein [Porphyrobacter sp. YT40]QDH33578.1 sugar phosphate isomerase/epimerase [Porphyrobacter sp. YT40]
MRLAMSNIAWTAEERLEAYAILAEAGITGLEIAPGIFFHAAADPFAPDAASADRALREIADAGLSLVSMQSLLFGVTGAALFGGAEARGVFERGMTRAIMLAGRFGIPNLVFGSPAQRRVPEGLAMADALEQAAAFFRRLGDAAAAAGTRISIEANPAAYGTNFLTTLEEAEAFVARVDHPAIAPILDLGAMHMNASFASVPARLPVLAPRLAHVHVSEPDLAPAPADAAALVPVLRGLKVSGYAGAVSIEMKRPPRGLAEVRGAVHRLVAAHRAAETVDA